MDEQASAFGLSPGVEVLAKAERRRFTLEYKRKILQEADSCRLPGELGAMLRREGCTPPTWRRGARREPAASWWAQCRRGAGRRPRPAA